MIAGRETYEKGVSMRVGKGQMQDQKKTGLMRRQVQGAKC